MNENKDIKMIDLFAGAEGMTLGFTQNNFKIIKTIENWKLAIETYNYNFNLNYEPTDITKKKVMVDLKNKFKNNQDWEI